MVLPHALFDLPGSIEPALADTGAERNDLILPERPLHILGPEGPRSALERTYVVHGATIILEKDTVLVRISKVEPAQGCLGIVKMKLTGRDAEAFRHAIAVSGGDKDMTIFTSCPAALTALLTFKANTITVKA